MAMKAPSDAKTGKTLLVFQAVSGQNLNVVAGRSLWMLYWVHHSGTASKAASRERPYASTKNS